MGVSLNRTPKTPQNDHFLVGKAMVVGETHHFRKPPYNPEQPTTINFRVLQDLATRVTHGRDEPKSTNGTKNWGRELRFFEKPMGRPNLMFPYAHIILYHSYNNHSSVYIYIYIYAAKHKSMCFFCFCNVILQLPIQGTNIAMDISPSLQYIMIILLSLQGKNRRLHQSFAKQVPETHFVTIWTWEIIYRSQEGLPLKHAAFKGNMHAAFKI